jgi:DNA-binding transcriptional regulator GbsR (MarR family)
MEEVIEISGSDVSQDRDELLRFVERFAMVLTEAGLPRMEARVFAYALAEDSDRYTAAELAEGLGVSRGAISSATRSLVKSGLLGREREPGARVDTYRIYDDDVWEAINRERLPILERYLDVLEEGMEVLDPESQGGRRLRETRAYMRFMAEAWPRLAEEWTRRKDEFVAEADGGRRDSLVGDR